mmetsp:Transcript_128956/g.305941  ORF Transcript_128956/g.305941 Transcript_128956/m.305941 type:complete len:248 (-) Transcript_128956:606-1349(-)
MKGQRVDCSVVSRQHRSKRRASGGVYQRQGTLGAPNGEDSSIWCHRDRTGLCRKTPSSPGLKLARSFGVRQDAVGRHSLHQELVELQAGGSCHWTRRWDRVRQDCIGLQGGGEAQRGDLASGDPRAVGAVPRSRGEDRQGDRIQLRHRKTSGRSELCQSEAVHWRIHLHGLGKLLLPSPGLASFLLLLILVPFSDGRVQDHVLLILQVRHTQRGEVHAHCAVGQQTNNPNAPAHAPGVELFDHRPLL